MKYENFEDLPVWQDGIDLTVAVFTVTEDKAFPARAGLNRPHHVPQVNVRSVPARAGRGVMDRTRAEVEARIPPAGAWIENVWPITCSLNRWLDMWRR